MNRYTAIAIFAMTLLFACKKTVTLDLNGTSARIVIQGEVTDSPGPYTVTINQSVDFYADNNFPPVSGALVVIRDNQGTTDTLTETSPGAYNTHLLLGRPGNTYTLDVFARNEHYVAASTMPEAVPLDSVTFESLTGFGQQRISAVVNFRDPRGVKNYYRFIEYINGLQFTRNIFIFDDRLSDGKYIVNSLRNDSSYLETVDHLEVCMFGIDARVYN